MKKLIPIFLVMLLIAQPSFAQSTKLFTLKDGSTIKAQLLGYNNGVYTIKNELFGQITLEEAKVVSMADEGFQKPVQAAQPTTTNGLNPAHAAQMSAVQNQLMTDPKLNSQIRAMAEDPEILQLISDPALMQELMAALNSPNPETIASNPKLQKLLANPRMQALLKQMGSIQPPQ